MRRIVPRLPSRPRLRGFSVYELLMVILIVAILFMLTAAGFREMSRRGRLRNSTELVVNTISYARSLAISQNTIIHVRIENRNAGEQYVSVYRFPKADQALQALAEENVFALTPPGWNTGSSLHYADNVRFCNVLAERKKLEPGVYFETIYNPAVLWDVGTQTLKPASRLHPGLTDLYYSGEWKNGRYPANNDNSNLLPKLTPFDSQTGQYVTDPPQHALLFFFPDGMASGNSLIFVRDDRNLNYVQVWKGGIVKSGQIQAQADFAALLR